jgi:two-component system NtrC family response regulator
MSPSFLDALTAYDWPGNVRELVNALTRALAAAQDEPTLTRRICRPKSASSWPGKASRKNPPHQDTVLCAVRQGPVQDLSQLARRPRRGPGRVEAQYLQDLMTHTGGDVTRACEVSG